MGRIAGALNRDHAETRSELAGKVARQLLATGGASKSLRELAEGAGVDPGTLRHYFGDRRGVIRAAFEHLLPAGEEQKARARALTKLPAREGLRVLLDSLVAAWAGPVGGMHAAGFVEGMADPELGHAYVSTILEPTLAVVEELLVAFSARGELSVPDARVGALALLSPVLVGLFHQHQLSGTRCRPLELKVFVEAHLDGFMRGYSPR